MLVRLSTSILQVDWFGVSLVRILTTPQGYCQEKKEDGGCSRLLWCLLNVWVGWHAGGWRDISEGQDGKNEDERSSGRKGS